jgi:hypothetical protein
MTFIVATRHGGWEIRESRTTPKGPRSRTLATFRELTEDVIEQARARASKPLGEEELRTGAMRVGAPVAGPPADRAASDLLGELAAGRKPRRALRGLIAASFDEEDVSHSDATGSVAEWVAATPKQRGEALLDLLLLTDRLPHPKRGRDLRFPRLESA